MRWLVNRGDESISELSASSGVAVVDALVLHNSYVAATTIEDVMEKEEVEETKRKRPVRHTMSSWN